MVHFMVPLEIMSQWREEQGWREHGKLLYDEIYFTGPTGIPVFCDKYKIDDIFGMGEADIILT